MYKVLHQFHDLTDYKSTKGGAIYHSYQPGDIYPRQGKDLDPNRAALLASSDNALGMPLIEEIITEQSEEYHPEELAVEQPEAASVEEEVKPKRTRRAKKEAS